MSTRGRAATPEPADIRRFREVLAALPADQGLVLGLLRCVIAVWCWAVRWRIEMQRAPLPRRDGVPGAGVIVVAAPHRAWVEPFLLLSTWPKDAARLVWLADGRTVTRSWWRRLLLPRLGVLPVTGDRRGPHHYAAMAAEILDTGHALAVFPEVGPPSAPDRIRRISPGFAYLALAAGAPVVPVVIGGTHRIVRGSTFSVDVLEAIDVGPVVDDAFTPGGRDRAHAITERLEAGIAAVLPERTAGADARAPTRERWSWLSRLFG